jgi:hypothetical protein
MGQWEGIQELHSISRRVDSSKDEGGREGGLKEVERTNE